MTTREKLERVRQVMKGVGESWPYMDDYSEMSDIRSDIDSLNIALEYLTDVVEDVLNTGIILDKPE